MHDGQKQFYNFIMERVKSGSEEHAAELLMNNFKKQDANTFRYEDIKNFNEAILIDLKDEHKEEVLRVMQQFGSHEQSK